MHKRIEILKLNDKENQQIDQIKTTIFIGIFKHLH